MSLPSVFPGSALQRADPRLHLPSAPARTVRELIRTRRLIPHFQPIAELLRGGVHGHEALIRTPEDCPFRNPDELFAAARHEDLLLELELECASAALRAFAACGIEGKLFVNLSAEALLALVAARGTDGLVALTSSVQLPASCIVVELTEHERVRDPARLIEVAAQVRRHGVALALDDFGDGRSSLRLWSELKPEVVKIDKYFTHEVDTHPERVQTLRALIEISRTLGAELVAEGVEREQELHVLRDLGIHYGQGWLIGRPQLQPVAEVLPAAAAVIASKDLAIFPERRRRAEQRATVMNFVDETAPVAPTLSNDELMSHLAAHQSLNAVALVDPDGRPIGLVARRAFVDRYAKPFWRELYGRKPCALFANLTPTLVELGSDIDELSAVLTSEDQRYLQEGFIVVRQGRYVGIGSSERLVRLVTEARIEAARHANPLTLLPGNIPLTQHIDRLLAAGREFVACYADLNHFKPFNDLYGYWRGDEMLLVLARALAAEADARRDFLGHVGGDDFIVLFQSDDWEARCQRLVGSFNAQAAAMYDAEARAAGGIEAEDRHGVQRFHPLSTVAIGAVRVVGDGRLHAEDVANAAARAKREAKATGRAVVLVTMSAGAHP